MRTPIFKRGRVILVAGIVTLAAAGFAAWRAWTPRSPYFGVVRGNISAEDQRQIDRLVRHDMWRQRFPDFSWRTVAAAPSSVYHLTRWHALSFAQSVPAGTVQVVGIHPEGSSRTNHYYFWQVQKLSKGRWTILRRGEWIGNEKAGVFAAFPEAPFENSLFEPTMDFSRPLSSQVKLELAAPPGPRISAGYAVPAPPPPQ